MTLSTCVAPLDFNVEASMSHCAKQHLLCLPAWFAPCLIPLIFWVSLLVGLVPLPHIGSGAWGRLLNLGCLALLLRWQVSTALALEPVALLRRSSLFLSRCHFRKIHGSMAMILGGGSWKNIPERMSMVLRQGSLVVVLSREDQLVPRWVMVQLGWWCRVLEFLVLTHALEVLVFKALVDVVALQYVQVPALFQVPVYVRVPEYATVPEYVKVPESNLALRFHLVLAHFLVMEYVMELDPHRAVEDSSLVEEVAFRIVVHVEWWWQDGPMLCGTDAVVVCRRVLESMGTRNPGRSLLRPRTLDRGLLQEVDLAEDPQIPMEMMMMRRAVHLGMRLGVPLQQRRRSGQCCGGSTTSSRTMIVRRAR